MVIFNKFKQPVISLAKQRATYPTFKYCILLTLSFLTRIATTPMIPPKVKLPVSPIKTCAGYELYHKKPMHAPTNELMKITNSEDSGMKSILR